MASQISEKGKIESEETLKISWPPDIAKKVKEIFGDVSEVEKIKENMWKIWPKHLLEFFQLV